MEKEKKGYDTPKVELIKIDDTDLILTSVGQQHGDNGHGNGCDGKQNRINSHNKNKGCL